MSVHAKLNPPKGFRPYGANYNYVPSAEVVDGLPVHYFSLCGWGYAPGNKGFGEYVIKQVGSRIGEYVRYNGDDVMDGRGDLEVGGDGVLYITANESDADRVAETFVVPGYVPFRNTTGQPVSVPTVVLQMVDLPDTAEMPNYGIDYKSDAEIMSNGLFYVRFNKLTNAVERDTAAIAQIQQVLKSLGYLK